MLKIKWPWKTMAQLKKNNAQLVKDLTREAYENQERKKYIKELEQVRFNAANLAHKVTTLSNNLKFYHDQFIKDQELISHLRAEISSLHDIIGNKNTQDIECDHFFKPVTTPSGVKAVCSLCGKSS